jgi:hypothetical protein
VRKSETSDLRIWTPNLCDLEQSKNDRQESVFSYQRR